MLFSLPITLLIALPAVWAGPIYCTLKPPKSAVSSGSNSTGGGGGGKGNLTDVVATGWFAGWHGASYTPENVTWSKYTALTYAFAVTTPDSSVLSLADSNEAQVPQFVDLAHQNGVAAHVSIGGWSGSQYFSSAVATAANRTLFVNAVLGLVSKYSLDGIDFDWEYPSKQGIGCNIISSSDSANFLLMLQQLRSQPAGKNLTLSAAVSITPFVGPNGTPMTDVSAFAAVLDYIEIMNYDVNGNWETTVGPNAPLNDTCATIKEGSAVSAVNAWTAAKFPANQIVLGVAGYGHSFLVPKASAVGPSGALVMNPPFTASQQPSGDAWSGDSTVTSTTVDQCGNPVGKDGVFNFWGLIDGGFLTENGTAASGMVYTFDNCSQTPYVYNPTTQVLVSYDDARSFAAKGQFINDQQLLGFSIWEVGGDYNNILIDAISTSIGIVDVEC
ncbi:glycoside hydrolase family 18 protein [Jaapia argillacea MUCL 33604]|uniref:Glycoside hydrolase family 18 protein n=1 Tax=Jaapia argillacea MUCL 33604 TaxID=933084 RepID=A0A067PZ77_9AGAM|nr:glycoside hydrolase family 18 protein [Jaapia argillacea MUCL 33604]